jgi:hypothetical protein
VKKMNEVCDVTRRFSMATPIDRSITPGGAYMGQGYISFLLRTGGDPSHQRTFLLYRQSASIRRRQYNRPSQSTVQDQSLHRSYLELNIGSVHRTKK